MLDHLSGGIKQRRVEHLHQHPETEMITLMRRSRKQKQIPSVLFEHLGQFEVLRLDEFAVLPVGGQMMRLVEHH